MGLLAVNGNSLGNRWQRPLFSQKVWWTLYYLNLFTHLQEQNLIFAFHSTQSRNCYDLLILLHIESKPTEQIPNAAVSASTISSASDVKNHRCIKHRLFLCDVFRCFGLYRCVSIHRFL